LLLALIHEQLGQPAEADKDLDEAMRMPVPTSDWLLQELAVDVITPRIAREPMNPVWLLSRFRCHARLGHPTAALADLDRAFELDPARPLRPNDVADLSKLGDAAAVRGEWPLVATAYTHIINVNPADSLIWQKAAIIQAFVGNTKEYRRVCEGLLKKFGKTGDVRDVSRIVKACLLVSGVIEERVTLAKLAELLGSETNISGGLLSWYRQTRAFAEYRMGRFAAVEEWCKSSLVRTPTADVRASVPYIAAMARYRQGESETARTMLAQAIAADPNLDGSKRSAGTWHDWLFVTMLRREAEALMAPELAPPPREVK
jgi:tetratricopeptide (TPR) repeat protein